MMPYRLSLALAALIFASPAVAWEMGCEVDDFTDEEKCFVKHSESGNFFNIGATDGGEGIGLTVGNFDSLFEDKFLIRVDNKPHRNIEDASIMFHSRSRGGVVAILLFDYANETIQEAINGDQLNVRLSEVNGPNLDMSFSTDGLKEAWNQFRERRGL